MQTGFCHIGELDFGLFRCGACTAAFSYVLLSTSGCLHHLIDGAVASLQEALREHIGDIVDDFAYLIDYQIAVIALMRNEF